MFYNQKRFSPEIEDYDERRLERDIDVIYLGRLTYRKGADILIRSLNKIRDKFKRCIIAGTGEAEDKIRGLIDNLNLDDKIKMKGKVEKKEAKSLLNRSKIFVLPAKNREPLPKSIMEAMIMKCAVISTRVGGIPEIVNSDNGILITPDRVDELSNTIEKLLEDEDYRKNLAQKGKEEMLKKFDKKSKQEELLQLYKKILGGKENV